MQISKFFVAWCVAAIGLTPLCASATDSPTQARAREAMREKMADMGVPQGAPQKQAPGVAARVATTNSPSVKKAREELSREIAAYETRQPAPKPTKAPAAPPAKEKPAPPAVAAKPVAAPSAAPSPATAQAPPKAVQAAPAAVPPAAQAVVVKQPPKQAETPRAAQPVMQKQAAELQPRIVKKEAEWPGAKAPPPSDSAALQRAMDQMHQKMAEMEAQERAGANVAAARTAPAAKQAPAKAAARAENKAKKAEAEAATWQEAEKQAMKEAAAKQKQVQKTPTAEKVGSVKPATAYKPLEPPEMPISAAKQQRLAELLAKYRADEITPEQYHVERARILAEP